MGTAELYDDAALYDRLFPPSEAAVAFYRAQAQRAGHRLHQHRGAQLPSRVARHEQPGRLAAGEQPVAAVLGAAVAVGRRVPGEQPPARR